MNKLTKESMNEKNVQQPSKRLLLYKKQAFTKRINPGGVDAGRWGPRTQMASWRTNEEGPWLHARWKSNAS